VVDPDDRELIISCGACLKFLQVALTHFGEGTAVTLLPNPADPDLMARIELTGPVVPFVTAMRPHAVVGVSLGRHL
jgi:hypothetical protein